MPFCFHQGPSSHQLIEATSPPNSSGYYSSQSPPHNSSNCSSPPHIYDRPTSPAKSNLSNGSGKPFFKPSAVVPLPIDQPAEKKLCLNAIDCDFIVSTFPHLANNCTRIQQIPSLGDRFGQEWIPFKFWTQTNQTGSRKE